MLFLYSLQLKNCKSYYFYSRQLTHMIKVHNIDNNQINFYKSEFKYYPLFSPPEFGSLVNPIPTRRGADYAHHINACPYGFENLTASLHMNLCKAPKDPYLPPLLFRPSHQGLLICMKLICSLN